MRQVSQEIKDEIANGTFQYAKHADIVLKSGVTLNLTDTDFWGGGILYEQSIANSGFEVGSAKINTFKLTISNYSGIYDVYDFTDADVSMYLAYDGGRIQIAKGVIVDTPEIDSSILELSGYDYMVFFDKKYEPYSEETCTMRQLALYCMEKCGFANELPDFPNQDMVVPTALGEEITYRQIIAWIAQASCTNAVVTPYGDFVFKWYSSSETAEEVVPVKSVTAHRASVRVTGVNVVEFLESDYDGEGNEIEPLYHFEGTGGYTIEIAGNRLIRGQASCDTVATTIYTSVSEMDIRAFNASIFTNPLYECGDAVIVHNSKGETFTSYINDLSFRFGAENSVSCKAESTRQNVSYQQTMIESVVAQAKRGIASTIKQVQQLNKEITQLISQGYGMNYGKVTLPNGNEVDAMFDGPTPETSGYVCYWTSNGIIASVDGGTTWAVDKNGNALLNALTVNKLTANQIAADAIKSQNYEEDEDGNVIAGSFLNLFDGVLKSRNVQIQGNIEVDSGSIGNWFVENGMLVGDVTVGGEKRRIRLNPSGNNATGDYKDTEEFITISDFLASGQEAIRTSIGLRQIKTGKMFSELYSFGDFELHPRYTVYSSGSTSDEYAYKPYYGPGDTIRLYLPTAGYVINSGKDVLFTVTLPKPLLSGVSVNATFNKTSEGIIVRQAGKFVYGATSGSTYIKPGLCDINVYENGILYIRCTMTNSTNAINNAECGVFISATLEVV